MSTIRKQSVVGSLIAVSGVFLGFFNSGYLQPKLLLVEDIGVLRYFLSLSGLLSVFCGFGVGTVLVKYNPFAKTKAYAQSLSGLFLSVLMIGHVLGFLALYVYLHFLQNELSAVYFHHVYLFFSVCFSFNQIIMYTNARAMVTTALFGRDILVKSGFVIILIVLSLFALSFETFLYLVEVLYLVSVIVLAIILSSKKKVFWPAFNFSQSGLPLKAMGSLGFYSMLSGSVAVLTKEIDVLMVARILDFDATGIYSIMLFFGILVGVPSRGLVGISAVKIGEAWANNHRSFLGDLYKKSAQNQLLVAGLVLVMLNANFFVVTDLMPKGDVFVQGLWAVFWLSLAQWVDMASGVSGELLYYSKHYKYGFYFSALLLLCLVIFNFIFIPLFGIAGAAFATFLSQVINNAARWYFLKRFYGLQPFNKLYLKGLGFILCLSLFGFYLRAVFISWSPIWACLAISVPLLAVFALMVLFTNWAPDLRERALVYVNKLGLWRNN